MSSKQNIHESESINNMNDNYQSSKYIVKSKREQPITEQTLISSPNGVTRIGYSATLHHISRLPSEVYRCSICNTTCPTSNELAIHTTHHYADYTPPCSPVSLIMIAIFDVCVIINFKSSYTFFSSKSKDANSSDVSSVSNNVLFVLLIKLYLLYL